LGDGLVVYGDGWAFMVSEPPGWHGDTEAASQYQVNIVFFPDAGHSKQTDVTIRVRVNQKGDDEAIELREEMKADMAEYRSKYPKVEFSDLDLRHRKYPLVAKLFLVRGEFFEYVAYVNPGKEYSYLFSVAMSCGEPATADEMAAYQKVLRSIVFMHKAP
jgi:hypothetical protein